MTIQVFPEPAVTSGDPASKTFPATAAGTYTMGYTLSAGVYEVTTDTVQSSHTITFETAAGYRYSGTVRGGKGYVSVASDVTKIIIPSGLTYPINYNIMLGAYTQIAACSATTASFTAGGLASFTFTAPSGATNITAFWTDGTSTSFATTSSPKTSVSIPNAVNNQASSAMLVATDVNGILGVGVSVTTSNNANIPITGGTANSYTSGATTYLSVTFLASGTLTVNTTSNIEYFIVGGGGPGGMGGFGGGGGGGGSTSGTQTSVSAGTYTVTVGAGGTPSSDNSAYGSSGTTSSIAFSTTRSAAGGGAGGMYAGVNNTRVPGLAGGCGGGGGMGYGASNLSGGTASAGFNGGSGQNYAASVWQGGGGGGGGGSAVGANAVTGNSGDGGGGNAAARAGAGGNGVSNSLRTGSAITYAGGGGGQSANPTYGNAAGGTGGGTAAASNVTAGGQNLGGGSGAGSSVGAAGGSGIVVVRVAL